MRICPLLWTGASIFRPWAVFYNFKAGLQPWLIFIAAHRDRNVHLAASAARCYDFKTAAAEAAA